MRALFKISILFGLLVSSLFAEINEYKSDLYYANGIMIDLEEPKALDKWKEKISDLLLEKPEAFNKIASINISYNQSQWIILDIIESLEQKISNEYGWKEVLAFIPSFLETHSLGYIEDKHIPDLTKQVASYKQSIKDGHGVIVIAHSQGNYYTNEAYEKLDGWMKEYFHMFGVATPADHVAGFESGDTTAPYVKFHNDFIKAVVGGLDSNMDNPNPDHKVVSFAAHDFYESYLTSENTKEKILSFIEIKIQEQVAAQSQWATDKEFDENTKEYRITIKHMKDTSIVMNEKVYPFAANKKLYQVKDTAGISYYVKASFGGEKILDIWDGQNEEIEFYKLQGTDELIKGEMACKDPANFEIVAQENENTATWRVTVKTKETNETTEDVYPFNLNGSLYQLDSGDLVLASCGGSEILDSWDGQKENEFYKLQGTEEIIEGEMVGECNNAPYRPDHFEVSWDFARENGNGKFVYYHSKPQEQGAQLGFSISAVDQDGYMFTDIDNNCFPEDVNVTISFDTFGEKSLRSVIQLKDDNTSLSPFEPLQDSGNQYSFFINTSEFVNGHVRKEYKINFERAVNIAKNPMRITINDVNISFADAVGNNSDDKNVTFVYAAAYREEAYVGRGYEESNIKMYYAAYCSDYIIRRDLDISGPESSGHVSWYYIESDENLDYDNPYSTNEYYVSVEKLNNNYIYSRKNASAPAGASIVYKPKDYLLYDKYRPEITTHSFYLKYL